MTNDNRPQAASRGDEIHGRLVEVGNAIPEDISLRGFEQNAALANGEFGAGADGCDTGVEGVRVEFVKVLVAHLIEARPGLACGRDELSRVITNSTRVERLTC